jgi:hypothetical protein
VERWFNGDSKAWKPDYKALEKFWEKDEQTGKGVGRIYGELSELAHPTVDATTNSVAGVSMNRGLNPNVDNLQHMLERYSADWGGVLRNQIWLTIADSPGFIRNHCVNENMPHGLRFHRECGESIDKALGL